MNFREFYLKEEKFIPNYFEMLSNGDLKLFNVKLIPDDILSKINSYMKRKGYDIRGIDDVRRILLKYENNSYGGVLSKEYSKDWIDAILLSLPKEKTPEEKIRSRVGRYFGITDDFKVAGYITPDGKLLDFSGRRQGNSFSVSRNIDHRQVGYAFENSEFEDKYSGTEGMKDFMDLGYVRISWPHSIHIRKPLTPQQRLTIQKFIRDSYAEDITLSLEGMKEPIYQNFETKEYKHNPSKLIQFIDRYFSSGFNKDSLTQRFHESNEDIGIEKFKNHLRKILGFDENDKPITIKRKTYNCKKCGKNNAYYKEEHPDTDMNEIVFHCPDCGYEEEK